MNIRPLEPSDLVNLKEIHEKHYKDEFPLVNILDHLLGSFIIEEDNQMICAGGVKTITESVLVTNKDADLHTKLSALTNALQINEFICRKQGYNQLHAFIKDDTVWRAYLKKVGFKKCSGNPYFLEIK